MRKLLPAAVVAVAMLAAIVLLVLLRPAQKPAGGPASAGNAATPAGETETIVAISPNSQGIQDEFARAFSAWHLKKFGAPCAVSWQDHGGTSSDVRYIASEFARRPDGIGVDFFWGGGMEPYLQFAERGWLQPLNLPPETVAGIPAAIGGVPVLDPERRWFGTALSSFGIVYNRRRLAEAGLAEPKTWEDLAAPDFIGLVGAADPRESGTALMMVEIILQAYGWDKGYSVLACTAGNIRQFTRGAGDVPEKVGLGEFAAGGAIDFYAWTQIMKDGPDKIGFVLPQDLTPVTPDCIGLLTGAPHAESARRFIEFVLSEDGQALWVAPKSVPGGPVNEALLRVPVLPKAYARFAAVTAVKTDPSKLTSSFQYDPQKSAARRDALKDLYGAMFVDAAPELRAAWKAVIARGLKPNEVTRLCAPPVTEAELTQLAATTWKDPAARNATIGQWNRRAKDLYNDLAK